MKNRSRKLTALLFLFLAIAIGIYFFGSAIGDKLMELSQGGPEPSWLTSESTGSGPDNGTIGTMNATWGAIAGAAGW